MTKRNKKYLAIINAATELFLEKGFQEASITSIMDRAGCSRETIYRYFKSKEDIFASAIQLQMEAYLQTMESITMGGTDDLRQGLVNWSLALIDSVTSESYVQFRRLVFSEVNSRPEHGKLYYDLTYEKGTSAVAEFFRLRQKEGQLKPIPARRLAAYFVGMLLYELVHQRVLGVCKKPTRARASKLVDQAVDDFLLGYGIGV